MAKALFICLNNSHLPNGSSRLQLVNTVWPFSETQTTESFCDSSTSHQRHPFAIVEEDTNLLTPTINASGVNADPAPRKQSTSDFDNPNLGPF
jgi:hypothetical protein